jgi:DNA-binding CsgD family transcriptional regulator
MHDLKKMHLDALIQASDALFDARDRESLYSSLKYSCKFLGFDQFTLSCGKKNLHELIVTPTLTMMDSDFIRKYDTLNWFESDVIGADFVNGERVIIWDSFCDRFKYVNSRSYLDFLQENSLGSGILASPFKQSSTINLLSFTSPENKIISPETIYAAQVLATYVIQKAEMLGFSKEISADEAISKIHLSVIQSDILKWIAEGKSNSEISIIMNLTERNTRYHTDQILKKLGVTTRVQAAILYRRKKIQYM